MFYVKCVACGTGMLQWETGNVCPSCIGDFLSGFFEITIDEDLQVSLDHVPLPIIGEDGMELDNEKRADLCLLRGKDYKCVPDRACLGRMRVLLGSG